jgi:metallophosphoesterase (TIGR00282 family)
MFKILAIGDICGPSGLAYIRKNLWRVRKENKIDMVIANGENCAEPNGIDKESAEALFESGVDVITTGNHVYRKNSVLSYLDSCDEILRPLNFPSQNPGHGDCIIKINGYKVLCMNVMGSVYMDSSACPFESVERCLKRNDARFDFAVLDIHAEATGEKHAVAMCYDGRFSVIFGTHTHVPTADEQILPKGTGYITDIGMCGESGGILGMDTQCIVERMRTHLPNKYKAASGEPVAYGALFTVDEKSGKCTDVRRISF